MFIAGVIGMLVFMPAAQESTTTEWTLATDDTRLTLAVSGGAPVITFLGDPTSGRNWLGGDTRVPLMDRVWVGEREITTAWTFVDGVRDDAAGPVTLAFENADPKLMLRSIWRARPGHGPVEHWIEIENRSGQVLTLGHQDSLALLGVSPGEQAELWWIKRGAGNASKQGGTFVEKVSGALDLNLISNCEDGASPAPWLAVQAAEARGFYVGWEFSGLGRIGARAIENGAGVDLQIGLLPDFKTDIGPGEVFLVPPAFVGCYVGDIEEGSYALHRWVLEKLRPSVPEDVADPTLAYNLYLDAGGDRAKEEDVLRSAAFCRDLGFEAFMPDAMWFPACGDWRWDPQRFPRGIQPIEEFVHGNGMRMALWCAWTNGGISEDPGALSVRGPAGHPEWFNDDCAANWKPGPFYGARVCLGCAEAKAWEIQKTQWLVSNHKLDYLKHDCGPITNACNKTGHRHTHGTDASYWATMGYYEVQEKLRQAFPRLLLENCSGGGHLKDYGAMHRTHYTVTTDTLSNLPDRQSIYDSTYAFPPLVLQAYTYERAYNVPGDDPGTFLWRSGMMGAWQIDPTNTRIWTDEERESAKRSVAIYKEWIRPILQDVKVHHILPRPDGTHWDGMFYWSPSLKRGTVYLFRPDAPEDKTTVMLKGLEPAKPYWLWCEDGSIAPGKQIGADLMDKGLAVELPQRYSSDLIFVQDADLGKPEELEAPGAFKLANAETQSDAFKTSATLTWTASANARAYRVMLSESSDFAAPLADRVLAGTSAAMPKLPADKTLFWKVQAVSYGGKCWNEDGPGSFMTPKLRELSGVTFVSDMEWVRSNAGAGNEVHRDTNYGGKEIAIAGKTYPKGVWTHSFNDATPADIVIDVSGKGFATFAADAGVEDTAGAGSVQFQVLVDGAVKAETPVIRSGMAHPFRVDVAGAKEVTLRVLNGGDGFACDHAAWGFARFIKVEAKDFVE